MARASDDELDRFRTIVDDFFRDEVVPDYSNWELAGAPTAAFWPRAGELGLLSAGVPTEQGGLGEDFRLNSIMTERAQSYGLALGGLRLITDICMPYLLSYGSAEQLAAWLPRVMSGNAVVALAITEPGIGSDMKAMRTTAVRDGEDYVVNGSKTFISNGSIADLIILAVKTDPDAGRDGLSLLLIDSTTPGFSRGRHLHKMGLKAQNLGEFFLSDVRVPRTASLLGEEGRGFEYLTANLAQERLSISVNAQASAAATIERTTELFSGRLNSQDVKFTLASASARTSAGQAMVDQAISLHVDGHLTPAQAAAVKLYSTENQWNVVGECLRLAGLDAYTPGSLIGRAYTDARAGRIYAGSSEVMRLIVAKSLGI
jgi:acyl-CoA dehydrogenase